MAMPNPIAAEGPVATSADVTVVVLAVGFIAYSLCFCSYIYLWHCRYFPPLRVKNPGLTVLANVAAFTWFLSLLTTAHLKPLLNPSLSACCSWQLFGRFLGPSVYMTAILAKQYRAFQHYAVGKSTYSSLMHVMLGQIPVLILMAIPVKLYMQDPQNCMNYDLADYISWGYEGLISILCFIMVLNLRQANTCYHYPNYGDSSLECLGMLLQTFFHGYVVLSSAFSDQTHRTLVAFGITVIIPITVFFGVLGNPMWRFYQKDAEFTRSFDVRFGSRVNASGASLAAGASLAGVYCFVGYRSPSRQQSRVRLDYAPGHHFEVEELSRLVMAGELRQVKQLLYNSTLGIINEKDSEGSTPLHRAVRNMHSEMIEFLLNMGADVDVTEADGVTALHVAASLGNVDCIYLLAGVNKANVNAMTEAHGRTALDIAVKSECMATICTLLNLGADPNRRVPSDEESEALTDIRSYIRKVGHYSKFKSPFFLAVELGLDRIINFMHSIYTPHGGVAFEAPEPQGMTPLCVASLLGHTAVIESLLTMKANPFNINKRQQRSALHYVCMKGSLKTFQILLKALSRNLLLQAANSKAQGPVVQEHQHKSKENEISCTVQYEDGALLKAANLGFGCGTQSDDSEDRYGVTCSTSRSTLENRSSSPSDSPELSVEKLPKSFFDFLNLQDLHGRTALHYAVLKGSAQITYMLLCLGADMTLEDTLAQGAGPPKSGMSCHAPRLPTMMGNPDTPTKGITARTYAELAQNHDPYSKVVAVFEAAVQLLKNRPDYPHQYLHDDTKWLPVS